MRLVLMVALAILVIPIGINAEQYCQVVNRNRGISNAKPLAAKINELLTIKGIKYKTTPKEINSTMKNWCSRCFSRYGAQSFNANCRYFGITGK